MRHWVKFSIVLIFIGLSLILILIFLTDGFRVKRVVKKGFFRASPEVVDRLVEKGGFMFSVDTGRIKEEVLKDPWIRDVTVSRVFPSTLVVEAHERETVALFLENGTLYYVDRDGTVFKKVEPWENRDLPVVSCFDRGNLSDALKVIDFFEKEMGLEKTHVSHVWKEGLDVHVVLEGGTEVVLREEDLKGAFSRFSRVKGYLPRLGFKPSLVDLRFRGRVLVRR